MMLYAEYAIDPCLLSNWNDFRYIIEMFGWDKGRLICRYPKKWKDKVHKCLEGCRPVEKKKIVETLRKIDDRIVRRKDRTFDENKDWLENVLEEHYKWPFKAILALSNSYNNRDIVSVDELRELSSDEIEQLSIQTKPLERRAEVVASSIEILLRSSKTIKIIDPYFNPNEKRYLKSIEEMLNIIVSNLRTNKLPLIEIHTCISRWVDFFEEKQRKEEKLDKLINSTRNRIGPIIKGKCNANLFIWERIEGGEKIHNRYILTDKAGIQLGMGVDEGKTGETDDIVRLGKLHCEQRFNQYSADSTTFNLLKGPIEISDLQKD